MRRTKIVEDERPPLDSLADEREAVNACRACPLWEPATQGVPGEGPRDARIVLVGEQPGDQEDLAGRPFVGPAGQLLDRALEAAELPRESVFVTNAVKHFLRLPDAQARTREYAAFVADLRGARDFVAGHAGEEPEPTPPPHTRSRARAERRA